MPLTHPFDAVLESEVGGQSVHYNIFLRVFIQIFQYRLQGGNKCTITKKITTPAFILCYRVQWSYEMLNQTILLHWKSILFETHAIPQKQTILEPNIVEKIK